MILNQSLVLQLNQDKRLETALSDGGKLSKQESEYAFRLVKLCRMITEQFEDMNDEEIRDSLKGD
jgi:hypothetical protein